MPDELVFYTNPMSRGRIVRWMLEEVGEPYRTVILNYETTLKGAEYLAINPMGKVPAITHGRAVVTEAAAICAYLADAFPEADLAPPLSDHARGPYFRWLFFAAGPIESAVTNKSLGFEVPAGRERMAGYGRGLDPVLEVMEAAVSASPYVAGDRFTAADVYFGSQVAWGMQFGSFDPRPAFTAYVERITARPAYRRAQEIDDALIAEASAATPA